MIIEALILGISCITCSVIFANEIHLSNKIKISKYREKTRDFSTKF